MVDQVLEQQCTQTVTLPAIEDGDGALAFFTTRSGRVTGNTNLLQFTVDMGEGHIGHMLVVVDDHQLIQHGFARLRELAQEAEVARLWRQAFDKVLLALAVFGLQRPDQHMGAVVERFDPVFAGGGRK
ncbi:hypothetical protein D3C79_875340 [compost metagenome]